MAKEDTERKISQLQVLEQNYQTITRQKQNYQNQKLEIEYALNELNDSTNDVYKVIGPVMVKSTKEQLKKDLNTKVEAVDLRINSIEKQEKQVKEKIESLQKEIVAVIGGEKK